QRSRSQELLHIAQELLHTEETYVRRLHLLDQVAFWLGHAFVYVHSFMGSFTGKLPILTLARPYIWNTNDYTTTQTNLSTLQRLAPFLKMYGEVKNFDRAVELVSAWTQRSPLFRDWIHEVSMQKSCGLTPADRALLSTRQGFPHFHSLTRPLTCRPASRGPEGEEQQTDGGLGSWARGHSRLACVLQEKMHKLLEVYEQLGGEEAVVNPANELIKEGHIQKLSAKTGAAQDRHLFLFNSMVLYCVPKPRLLGQKFSVREKMDISDLQVQDTSKPPAAPTFILTGRSRALELRARTEEEKKEWIQVIEATISKHKQNSQTFKAFSAAFSQDEDPSQTPEPATTSASFEEPAVAADGRGGAAGLEPKRGSSKIRRDKEKQSCKGCGETFNSITKRRHHCKLCGAAICGKCSEFKAESGRQSRVCGECFLTQPVAPASTSPRAPAEPQQSVEWPRSVDPPGRLPVWPLWVSDGGLAWSKVPAATPAS
uniref:FYVE, RhoGEF and PH domain containing 3 n=1 Tax=Myotis lucifugus TaxID=59463 RepID=G1PKR9_MYOLU